MSSQTDIERQEKADANWRELEHIANTHVCAECEGRLIVPYDSVQKSVVIRCGTNKTHTGFKKIPSFTELWRRGQPVPPEIQANLEKKYRRQHMETEQSQEVATYQPGALSIQKPQVLLAVVQERYPELDAKSAMLFCYHAMRMGLDPLLNEIYPTVFTHHRTGKQVLVPIISEMGMGSLAARARPQDWNGPPDVTLVTDPDLKEAVCGDRDAWVWAARGRRKNWEQGREYSTYGWMTQAQIAAAIDKKKPSGELPGNQARIRAIKRWLLEAYPEASNQVRAAAIELQTQAEGVQEALDCIEAEYTVDGKAAKPTHPAAPLGVCPIHHVALIEGKYGTYCPKKVKNDKGEWKYCKGVPKGATAAQQQASLLDDQPPGDHPESSEKGEANVG